MKRNLLSTFTAGSIITACALLTTQVFARGHAPMFDKFDQNSDGKITRTEAHNIVLEKFRSADSNKDNVVTTEEAKRHREAMMKDWGNPEKFVEAQFKAHDKNNNGKIERSESQLPEEIFKRIDKNSDGSITKQEALDAHRERSAKRQAARAEGAKKHDEKSSSAKDGREKRGHRHGGKHGSPFSRLDTNGDGKITVDEAKGAADQVFSRLDENKDNVVTRAEALKARENHRPANRKKGHEKKSK